MKMFTFILLLVNCVLFAQQETIDSLSVDEAIYVVVQDMPKFQGGNAAMMSFIYDNISYPEEAFDKKLEGSVIIAFIIEKNGSLSNIEIRKDIGGGCGEEAIRVIKLMPKWQPGIQMGKPVRVQYDLSVTFKLPEEIKEKKPKKKRR